MVTASSHGPTDLNILVRFNAILSQAMAYINGKMAVGIKDNYSTASVTVKDSISVLRIILNIEESGVMDLDMDLEYSISTNKLHMRDTLNKV